MSTVLSVELEPGQRHTPGSPASSSGRVRGAWARVRREAAWLQPLVTVALCIPIFQRWWQVYVHQVPQV